MCGERITDPADPRLAPYRDLRAGGLAAGVWRRDVSKAHRVARAIRAGTVWVNCYNVFDPAAPFGGSKESGYGRDLGRYALDLYTQLKSVWMRI